MRTTIFFALVLLLGACSSEPEPVRTLSDKERDLALILGADTTAFELVSIDTLQVVTALDSFRVWKTFTDEFETRGIKPQPAQRVFWENRDRYAGRSDTLLVRLNITWKEGEEGGGVMEIVF